MNLKRIAISVFTILAISACGSSKHDDGGGNTATKNPDTTQKNTAAAFHYYKGDGGTAPASFDYDMTISFDTTGYKITAKDADDSLCSKSGTYTEADAKQLFDLVAKLEMVASPGPTAPGDGIETIEISLTSGEKLKYHLLFGEVPKDELYAKNPTELRTYLQSLEASLATACQ